MQAGFARMLIDAEAEQNARDTLPSPLAASIGWQARYERSPLRPELPYAANPSP
jgi:hypothetical protein